MNRDSVLYRYLRFAPYILIFLLALFLFGSRACDLALKGGAKRLLTLARFHNLKTAMSFCTDMVSKGEADFPQNTDELLAFFRDEMGMTEKDLDDLGRLHDGWGRAMVLEGDLDDYTVRSAGPDRKFYTEDDITLEGNLWGEHVKDGSSRRRLSPSALKRQINKLPFQDPTGYYHISLPGAYTVIDEFQQGQSVITFFYAQDNYVRITAEPSPMDWDTDQEMENRLDTIRAGEEEELLGFAVEDYGPVQVQNGTGYWIRLESAGLSVQEYDLMGGYVLRVQVRIVSSGKDRDEILSILSSAVESTLDIHF